MKRALFIMSLLAASIISMAQEGTWYVGGVVGYNSNTAKSGGGFKTVTSGWAFGPEVGTFLKDDIQLGFVLGLAGSSLKNDTNELGKSTSFSPTLYGRKFFKITDTFSTFAGVYLNYTGGSTTIYTPTTVESTQSGIGIRLGVGVAYSLSPRFTAVGQYGLLGYQSLSNKVGGVDAGSNSSFDFGVNTVGSSTMSQGNGSGAVFNIGLYYTFKKV